MTDFLDDIERSVPTLRRYARALTGNREQADDLVQDCLERALRKRLLWRPKSTVKSWLMKMMLNIYRNDLRHKRRRAHLTAVEDLAVEPSVEAGQPARLALAETAKALDRLPEEQREALLLVVVEGLAYAEAADVLGVPLGTLMSRLGRARANLRDMTGTPAKPQLRSVT